jgi:sodium transport system permease protein
MKNNTWTIMRKEFNRFFNDRGLFFTVVIMPGLLIFLIYTLLGDNMDKQFQEDTNAVTSVYVDNLPTTIAPLFDSLPYAIVTKDFQPAQVKKQIADKDNNVIYMVFPVGFMDSVTAYDPACGRPAPNIQIFYNSSSPNSLAAYTAMDGILGAYENTLCNRFDVNALADSTSAAGFYDAGDANDVVGDLFGQLLPMIIIMLISSACMSVAPTSIAGEKERGTIATLLVTPMRRNQLALGKIFSLSGIAMLSGISSFLGIITSLPKMIHTDDLKLTGSLYSTGDYIQLLIIILSTVLILISITSIISAYANSVKSAQTMTLPLMILVMAVSFTPMLGAGVVQGNLPYLIPFYNSVQCMAAVFSHSSTGLPLLITIVSNGVYTILAAMLLTKMFNSEKVMFGK